MNSLRTFLLIGFWIMVFTAACARSEPVKSTPRIQEIPVTVEVTRLVEQPIPVIEEVEVQVTGVVDRPIAETVEVTRIVEVLVTPSSEENKALMVGAIVPTSQPTQPPLVTSFDLHAAAPEQPSNNVNAFAMVSKSEAWAVGDDGLLLHFKTSEWTQATLSIDDDITDVHLDSADSGWATTSKGKVLRWTGTQWTIHTDFASQFSTPFYSPVFEKIAFIANDDIWAIGTVNGESISLLAAHWDGQSWREVPITTSQGNDGVLTDATVTDDGTLLVVGTVGVSNHMGILLKWDDTEWQELETPATDWIWTVAATHESNIWVTGAKQGASDAWLWYWDGDTWNHKTSSRVGILDPLYAFDDMLVAGGRLNTLFFETRNFELTIADDQDRGFVDFDTIDGTIYALTANSYIYELTDFDLQQVSD